MPETPPSRYWSHPRTNSKAALKNIGGKKSRSKAQPIVERFDNSETSYVELQVVSNFSFLQGASHPEELIQRAAELGYSAIALTDIHSLAGVVRAHVAAKLLNISLIVGASVYLYDAAFINSLSERSDPLEHLPHLLPQHQLPCSLVLHPTSRAAYGRLCSLLTTGKMRAPKGECFLSLEDIREHHCGMHAGLVIHNLHHPELYTYLRKLHSYFDAERLSLIINNTYGPGGAKRLRLLEELGKLSKLPLLATNDIHFHIPERRTLQDVLTCTRNHTTLTEAGLSLFQNAERYLKGQAEMTRLFAAFPHAIRRSQEVAKMALQFSLDQLSYEYPEEICPSDQTPQHYLTELTFAGAKNRYPDGVPEEVHALLVYELKLIDELSYAKYFLTVYDIVRFAREQQILCQGRGAAANSAVCYVLGITSVPPDKIHLLFERFISKERGEPPDIDIDFEHERREEVIQYIYAKYGRHRAALTATVITYRTRSAIRDIGKVFDLPVETIEQIIKLYTRSETSEFTDSDLRARALDPSDSRIRQTIALTNTLRGFPRHLSQHPGGFIISEQRLSEIVPIENASMPDRTVMEWDKDDIESMGMLKIDVLGLGMLTCIRKAFEMLNSETLSPRANQTCAVTQPFALHTIPQDDPAVYEMISAADTIGVFQIESRAQMTMLPRLKPNCFYDLVIEVAIVRPGPIQGGMVHPYLRRRSGIEAVSYPNEKIEAILKPTLGVPIFQEQVMELAVVAAGFTRGEADQLRRAMASWKKSKNALAQFEKKLIGGMLANGYERSFAERVFQQIQGFGEYGFPQSHAASFALLVYVSAWIKHHHPAVFTAALLNSQPMGFYQPAQLIDDVKKHGVEVRTVDVNHSDWDCSIEPENYDAAPAAVPELVHAPVQTYGSKTPIRTHSTFSQHRSPALRLGIRLVSGVSELEVAKITAAVATAGPFVSPKALWRASSASTATLRTLARADSFSSMKLNRQQALWQVAKLNGAPLPLFETGALVASQEVAKEPLALPYFSDQEEVVHDYQTLGFSLKAHPLSFLRLSLAKRRVSTCAELKEERLFPHGTRVAVAGLVLVRQRPMTASGVVFMTIEDETGIANLIVKPRLFSAARDVLCDSVFLLASGAVQRQGLVVHILLEEATNLTPRSTELGSQSRDFH